MKIDQQTKKTAGRAFLVLIYLVFIGVFFLTGRTHTVIIDNKDDPEGRWQAIRGMSVSINGGEPSEYLKGDRDKVVVKGQRMALIVEFFDGSDNFTKTITIPLGEDTLILSVPKLLEGITPALVRFDIYGANRAITDSTKSERFGQEEPESATVE